MTLRRILADAARGVFPPTDGSVSIVPQPSERDAEVISFTGHTVVFADTDPGWIRGLLPPDSLSAPLNPPFLGALCERIGRRVNNIGILMLTTALQGPPPSGLGPRLEPAEDHEHPRVDRALRHRENVRARTTPGGMVLVGQGVAGRWDAAVEVDPKARGTGLGRLLARAARHLIPDAGPLWAQVAPGNAASVRALLAAGFVPVGAEALLVPEDIRHGPSGQDAGYERYPSGRGAP
jgi:GNAT superfamily N-acetyltransferase